MNRPSLNARIGIIYPGCLLCCPSTDWWQDSVNMRKRRTWERNLWAAGCHFIWRITLRWIERKRIACSYNGHWVWVLLLFSCKFSQLAWHAIHCHSLASCLLMQFWGAALATAHANIRPYVDDTMLCFTPLPVVANWTQLRQMRIMFLFSLKQ